MLATIYYVGRFNKEDKLIYLDSGPFVDYEEADQNRLLHKWTSSNYKVLEHKIEVSVFKC